MTPFAVVYALHFNRRMNRALERSKQQIAAVNERVEDALAGIRVVQSFTNEGLETGRFGEQNQKFLESRADGYRSEAWFSVGTETFAQLVTILVIVLGALRILSGELTVAEMLTFLLCVAVLVDPVQRLANFVRLWQEGYTGFVRAMEILEVEPDIADRPGATELPLPEGAIRFDRVGFRYEADGPHVLSDLSLDIRAGRVRGAGRPVGGGQEHALCADPALLRCRCRRHPHRWARYPRCDAEPRCGGMSRLVQQDVYLFAGTVAENLRYGRPDATDEDIDRGGPAPPMRMSSSCALPCGYDTDIGQRGVKLSGRAEAAT